jgi:hypothetical protein
MTVHFSRIRRRAARQRRCRGPSARRLRGGGHPLRHRRLVVRAGVYRAFFGPGDDHLLYLLGACCWPAIGLAVAGMRGAVPPSRRWRHHTGGRPGKTADGGRPSPNRL